jgi:hypothetical protein
MNSWLVPSMTISCTLGRQKYAVRTTFVKKQICHRPLDNRLFLLLDVHTDSGLCYRIRSQDRVRHDRMHSDTRAVKIGCSQKTMLLTHLAPTGPFTAWRRSHDPQYPLRRPRACHG